MPEDEVLESTTRASIGLLRRSECTRGLRLDVLQLGSEHWDVACRMATEAARRCEPEPLLTDHPGPIGRALAKLLDWLDPITALIDDTGGELDAPGHLAEGVAFEILAIAIRAISVANYNKTLSFDSLDTGTGSSNSLPLHHPVPQFSDLSENRSESARVRAICNHAWTQRTPSAAFAPAGRPFAQPSLDPFPKLAADYRLVLPRMAFLLVTDLAHVDWVGEQVVKRSARKLLAASGLAVP